MSPQATDQPFEGARVLVGVSGGIAAYKTCTLVSRLAQAGAEVTVAMTAGAARFVTPMTFQALSARPVYTDPFEHIESHDPQHVRLARSLDAAIVAPCTMNMMATLAHGFASDAVSLILSAVRMSTTPVLLAPSMNSQMWLRPSTQRNLNQLMQDGYEIITPEEGWQACRTSGPGRMAEPDVLLARLADAIRTTREVSGGGRVEEA